METTKINNLKINVLTQAQYNSATKDENQLYLITDTTSLSLPEVSTADNGKILRVVDGVWVAASLPNAEGVKF